MGAPLTQLLCCFWKGVGAQFHPVLPSLCVNNCNLIVIYPKSRTDYFFEVWISLSASIVMCMYWALVLVHVHRTFCTWSVLATGQCVHVMSTGHRTVCTCTEHWPWFLSTWDCVHDENWPQDSVYMWWVLAAGPVSYTHLTLPTMAVV